ncbi:hypothetical protein M1K48_00685 [Sphingomonas glaciei]|uniref:Uncharacterized protein n=1 Tax=Sphingomonas glaciei TaxID=2938948 RepID=A0ABY5MVD3_9SPHN|nr:hypothetical protein M1K48_00685 [Sphingomonas glaciei]
MSFRQLSPPLPIHVADRAKGQAMAVIDYGPEFDLLWVVAMDEGGEIWCVPNPQVRMQANWSLGRSRAPTPGLGKLAPVPSVG